MNDVSSVNNKKRLRLYYGLLVTVLCVIGVSFAWFRLYLSQSEDNTLSSRTCFSVSLNEESSKIEITDAFPISNKDGLEGEPFTFTLKNNCEGYVRAYITIDSTYRESSDASYLSDDYLKVNLSSKGATDRTSVLLGGLSLIDLENSRKGYLLKTEYLNSNEEKSFDLRVWMDSDTTIGQGLNKKWAGKIVVVSDASMTPAPNGWYSAKDGTLLAAIKRDNSVTEPLTSPGKDLVLLGLDDIESNTLNLPDAIKALYITYGTGWEASGDKFNLTGTAVTSDTYTNSYADLAGKYITTQFGSATAGTMVTTTNLSEVVYVVSTTADTMVVKNLTSNKNVSEAVLASAEDDYGISYYFRGMVKNNYVEFAGKCWRIVRVTGDGSIKLALHNDNKDGVTNPCAEANNSDTAAFANVKYTNSSGDVSYYNYTYYNVDEVDNFNLGFMFGNAGCAAGAKYNQAYCTRTGWLGLGSTWNDSTSYGEAHANINKSEILDELETWYSDNFTSYDSNIADTIWCNDKSVITKYANGEDYGTGLGYGTNQTGYGSIYRLYSGSSKIYANPSLVCPNDALGGNLSKYTVNDKVYGNGDLTYKVGLLTADELAFAGFMPYAYKAYSYLLDNTGSSWWWTMTPNVYDGSSAYIWVASTGGFYGHGTEKNYKIRPAISLVSSTLATGSGTSENPYKVV